MRKHTSKLTRVVALLILTLVLSTQAFGNIVYARGSSKASSHSYSSKSSSTKSGSFSSSPKSSSKVGTSSSKSNSSSGKKATPSSSAKSGSFSSSPKSSNKVGSSNSSTKTINNNTVIVNNHTYLTHSRNSFFFIHRTYYVDDYGTMRYMPYRPSFSGVVFGLIFLVIIIYVVLRIAKNKRN